MQRLSVLVVGSCHTFHDKAGGIIDDVDGGLFDMVAEHVGPLRVIVVPQMNAQWIAAVGTVVAVFAHHGTRA